MPLLNWFFKFLFLLIIWKIVRADTFVKSRHIAVTSSINISGFLLSNLSYTDFIISFSLTDSQCFLSFLLNYVLQVGSVSIFFKKIHENTTTQLYDHEKAEYMLFCFYLHVQQSQRVYRCHIYCN